MLENKSHGSDALFRIRMQKLLEKIASDFVFRDMLEGLLEAVLVPQADLTDFCWRHCTLASA
jgi:hypothetical protein